MGKHDKAQHFSWSPAPDDFYKARITVLEKENRALVEKVRSLEMALGNMELVVEHGENVSNGINNELKDIIAEKDAEIETLREALLNAVTRLGWEMK